MESAVKSSPTAVVLMAYGAAESLKAIPGYLKDILGGRPVSEELVKEITGRYKAMGGRSPLVKITEAQRKALEKRLKKEISGREIRVYAGMRHSKPTILSAVKALRKDGCREIVSVPMTPYDSKLSVGAYRKTLSAAISETGGRLKVLTLDNWHVHPKLIEAYAEKIRAAYDTVPMLLRTETVLLLTAHSLPERIIKEGDAYPDQLEAAAAAVASQADFDSWRFAYQSRAISAREPWLGPDAGEVLEELADAGCKSVLLAPIGFLSDHLETLYDDDVLYRDAAEKRGLHFSRAEALNASPHLIEALSDLIRRCLKEA